LVVTVRLRLHVCNVALTIKQHVLTGPDARSVCRCIYMWALSRWMAVLQVKRRSRIEPQYEGRTTRLMRLNPDAAYSLFTDDFSDGTYSHCKASNDISPGIGRHPLLRNRLHNHLLCPGRLELKAFVAQRFLHLLLAGAIHAGLHVQCSIWNDTRNCERRNNI
jgi:hypothetical protein